MKPTQTRRVLAACALGLLGLLGCDDGPAAVDMAPPDAAVDGARPDAVVDAADAGPIDAAPVDRGLTPDVMLPDAAPPDPDAGWPAELDLVALFDAYERGEIEPGEVRAALRAAPEDLRIDALPAVLEQPAVVPPGVTIVVAEATTIGPGALLALAPGARIELAAGVALTARGRLYAMGSADAPVEISGEGFDAVRLLGGPNTLRHVRVAGGDRLLAVSHDGDRGTRIQHATLDHWVDVALDLPNAIGVELSDSRIGLESAPDEGGEMVRTRGGGAIRITGNVFGPRRGYRDIIDLQDCVGEWPQVVGNRFAEGEDDAIDLDRCSAIVAYNHIRDFRPLDIEVRRAGINGGGITGDGDIDIVIVGNVIERCYHGIGFKNGARPVMVNNTVIDGNIGVSLYQSAVGQPLPHGVMINNLLTGNRDWLTDAPQDIVLHGRWWPTYNQQDAVQATLDADHNTLASGGELAPGQGNDAADPQVERRDGWPLPGAGSPALDSARGAGLPEGAVPWLRDDARGAARVWMDGVFVDLDRGAIER